MGCGVVDLPRTQLCINKKIFGAAILQDKEYLFLRAADCPSQNMLKFVRKELNKLSNLLVSTTFILNKVSNYLPRGGR